MIDVKTRHAVAVDADAATLDRALRAVTFGDVPLVRALVFARGLGLPARTEKVIHAFGRPTQTRVHVPAASGRRFQRYWLVVRPFSGLIRASILQAAKRRAEAT